MAYRVLADHARTLTIALSDGETQTTLGEGKIVFTRSVVQYIHWCLQIRVEEDFKERRALRH
jgi:hypothetical protein